VPCCQTCPLVQVAAFVIGAGVGTGVGRKERLWKTSAALSSSLHFEAFSHSNSMQAFHYLCTHSGSITLCSNGPRQVHSCTRHQLQLLASTSRGRYSILIDVWATVQCKTSINGQVGVFTTSVHQAPISASRFFGKQASGWLLRRLSSWSQLS